MKKLCSIFVTSIFILLLTPSGIKAATHPQIFFGPNDITSLRQKATSNIGASIWGSTTTTGTMLWWLGKHFNDAYPTTLTDKYAGRLISKSAMAYLITGDVKYAQKAHDWIMYFVNNFSDWQGGYGNGGTSYYVSDIVLGYDWIQSWWVTQPGGEAEMQLFRNKLLAIVPTIDLPTAQGGCDNRHRSYVSIGLAGYALKGEVPEADDWILKSKNWFSKYISLQGYGNDGFWTDGPDYGAEEQSQKVGILFAAAKYHNDNYWDTQWSRNQKYYWSYLWTGATKTYDFFPTGDSFNYEGIIEEVVGNIQGGINNIGYHMGDGGPTMFFFSYLYNDPILQNFAKEQTLKAAGRYYWDPSVIWALDSNIGTQSPVGIWPLSHYFPDFEAVVAKSDWTANGTQFYLKAGVHNGKVGYQNNMVTESYEGHAQMDANGIMIYSRGEYMVVKDAYTTPRFNRTISTILSDGGGQIIDGAMWGGLPRAGMENMGLRSVVDTDNIFYTVGDGAPGYNATKLNKFDRHVAFFRPDIFVIFDEVGQTNPHRYDWMLQMEYDKTTQILGNNQFRIIGSRTTDMNVTFLKPSNLSYEQGSHQVNRCTNISSTSPCELGPVMTAPYISFYPSTNVAQTQFLTVLETKAKGGADSSVVQIPATNGTGVLVGLNNYCLSADIGASTVNSGLIKTTGRFICWQGNQTSATTFVASPAQQIEISPYKITASSGNVSIGFDQLKGEFTSSGNTNLTLEYPNVTGVLIDDSQVNLINHSLNSVTFVASSGRHKLELVLSLNTPTPTPLLGDLNHDKVVNIQDFILLSNDFNKTGTGLVSDLNNDQVVNIQDFIILSNNFGKT